MMMMILGLLLTRISTPSLVREKKINNNNDIITNIGNTKIISYMIY